MELHEAKKGCIKEVKPLQRNGCIKEVKALPLSRDAVNRNRLGWTTLPSAAASGHDEAVEHLMRFMYVDVSDDAETTPLIQASMNGHLEVVKRLITDGAQVEAVDGKTKMTSLIIASMNGHHEVVRHLIDNGARLEAVDGKEGATALIWACFKRHTKVVQNLLTATATTARLAATSKKGLCPLHLATYNGLTEAVAMLLEKGACVADRTQEGDTALDLGLWKDRKEAVKLLHKHGARPAAVAKVPKRRTAPPAEATFTFVLSRTSIKLAEPSSTTKEPARHLQGTTKKMPTKAKITKKKITKEKSTKEKSTNEKSTKESIAKEPARCLQGALRATQLPPRNLQDTCKESARQPQGHSAADTTGKGLVITRVATKEHRQVNDLMEPPVPLELATLRTMDPDLAALSAMDPVIAHGLLLAVMESIRKGMHTGDMCMS
ncbi:Protein TANC1 [Tetrabaena socialis]|uniref:Protein TANC1 n=1 Tax=Tetrabaena socialis TaxID=47790 RepID=A0A2J8A104_9CHLO|nr:Protein TANC1 [Tetrabaena socialis]|eukprot:PNH06196.1 Protein TANC1 [Tetrabaena socialis]